ncbi:PREDICTED: uncharacterized protein LOC108772205, partial [Cyphomyrmex costatus]|uniref:uncharacterized protein LOC108772205 n=1 Tax=Cyphomyrmex costatus TaxID=456900 RepID=UPI0008523532
NEERVINALQDDNITILLKNINEELMTKNAEIDEDDVTVDINNKENQNIHECLPMKRKGNRDTDDIRAPKLMKEKKTRHTLVSEDDIKMERIKHIMEQEKEIADMRKVHEEKLNKMKEEFHIELYSLEIRTARAKSELAELQLQKEKENMK